MILYAAAHDGPIQTLSLALSTSSVIRTMADETCITCGRRLNVESDALSGDCGGDCWGCVGEMEADMGYKPSIEMVLDEWRRGLRPNWTPPELPETITVWTPIGAAEFEQIAASHWRALPETSNDRLIFLNKDIAARIARDWDGPLGGGWLLQIELKRAFCWRNGLDENSTHEHRDFRFGPADIPRLNEAVVGEIKVVEKFG